MKSRKKPAVTYAPNPIDAATLKSIARLAKIDPRKPKLCKRFFLMLRADLNIAWSVPKGPPRANYRAPVIRELARWSSAIAALKELSRPDENNPAAFHALGHIRAVLSHERTGALDLFEDFWKSLLDDLERAVLRATGLVQQKYQKTGHPAGGLGTNGVGNVGANMFVTSLIYAVEASGGHLSKSRKDRELQGPLIEAIDLLRPYLPASLLPPATAVSFYERIATIRYEPESAELI